MINMEVHSFNELNVTAQNSVINALALRLADYVVSGAVDITYFLAKAQITNPEITSGLFMLTSKKQHTLVSVDSLEVEEHIGALGASTIKERAKAVVMETINSRGFVIRDDGLVCEVGLSQMIPTGKTFIHDPVEIF